jgi:flavodoxin
VSADTKHWENKMIKFLSPFWPATLLLALLGVTLAEDVHAHSIDAWVTSADGAGAWRKINSSSLALSALRFGDFDGNGKTDVFRAGGGKWFVSFDGTGAWQQINTSNVDISLLRFGDFNGNGKTDVFRAGGGKWFVSFDGIGAWQQINTSNANISLLRFGDFDGNGTTDVFRAGGGKWFVSFDGTGAWQQINTSNVDIANLRFGDFNGNGRTDVFRSSGGKWFIAADGVGAWKQINTSNVVVSSLGFADFDGNGRTDVFRSGGSKWFVSFDAAGPWQEINRSGVGVASLRFGDFDGNGKADVFRVASEDHVGLRVRRFASTVLDDARADVILADATVVLQTNDGAGDRACLVHFTRDGAVTQFSTGDGSIDSQSEFNAVIALPGFVKVVNQINWCGGIIPNVIGCAPVPGSSLVVVRFTANQEGILWAHEYGHTQSLSHRTDTSNAVMFPSIGTNRRKGHRRRVCGVSQLSRLPEDCHESFTCARVSI